MFRLFFSFPGNQLRSPLRALLCLQSSLQAGRVPMRANRAQSLHAGPCCHQRCVLQAAGERLRAAVLPLCLLILETLSPDAQRRCAQQQCQCTPQSLGSCHQPSPTARPVQDWRITCSLRSRRHVDATRPSDAEHCHPHRRHTIVNIEQEGRTISNDIMKL